VRRQGGALATGEILDVLGSRVGKSLVAALADGRYRLLETGRLNAEERLLAADEAAYFRDSHCDWFVQWACCRITVFDGDMRGDEG
jgi:hypothetical protein